MSDALGGGPDADERARLVVDDDPARAIEQRAAELTERAESEAASRVASAE